MPVCQNKLSGLRIKDDDRVIVSKYNFAVCVVWNNREMVAVMVLGIHSDRGREGSSSVRDRESLGYIMKCCSILMSVVIRAGIGHTASAIVLPEVGGTESTLTKTSE